LSEVWYFIPSIITASLFPAIVSAKKISEELYYTRLQRLYTLLVWSSIAIALPMTFLSERLVTVLYGDTYKDAAQVLMIYIWAGVFVSLGVASGAWLTSQNLQNHAFYRTFFGAIINVIMNLVLIPIYGMIGSAIATVIAQMMAALLFDVFSSKTRIGFFMKLKTLYFADVFQRG
jgi:O-antigen/teichoic acid export membrane protein